MTISGFFTIQNNRLAALEQEYELAKEQHGEILKYRDPLNPEHEKRFRDACERLETAREAWIGAGDSE
jgi:hypothetical protein